MTEFHMTAYAEPTPITQPLPATLYRIAVPGVTGAQHNPSVVSMPDGALKACVRVLDNRGHSTTYLADVDSGYGLQNCVRLEQARVTFADRPQISRSQQRRFAAYTETEDLRLFLWQDALWAVAATHGGPGNGSSIRQTLVDLRDPTSFVAYVQPGLRHEKNWMPCAYSNDLRLVYSVDPLNVLAVRPETVSVALPVMSAAPGRIRGSSQVIPYGPSAWIAIVHEVWRPPPGVGFNPLLGGGWAPIAPAQGPPVVYLHRFVKFNHDLTKVTLGSRWHFHTLGIEFCAGLAWRKDALVASFGVADREAWLAVITPDTVESTFA